MKSRIDRHIQISRDSSTAYSQGRCPIFNRKHKEPCNNLFIRTPCMNVRNNLLDIFSRKPVQDRTVSFSSRHPQHPLAQRGDKYFGLLLQLNATSKAFDLEGLEFLGDFLTRKCLAEKANHVSGSIIGALELDPVPILHDDIG